MQKIAIGVLFLIVLVAFIFLQTYKTNKTKNIQYKLFGSQIQYEEKTINQLGCKAGEDIYLSLSQNYKYNDEFDKSLKILSDLADCYPMAYKVKSQKSLLLLNNVGDLYESWGYYLKQKSDPLYKDKYEKAITSYDGILKNFDKLDKDMVEQYQNKIKRIKDMMK